MNKAGVTGEFELRDKVKQKWQQQLQHNQEKAMHIVADRTTPLWCMTDIMKDWVCLMSRRLRNLCHHGFATKGHASWMRELMGEAGDFYDPLMLKQFLYGKTEDKNELQKGKDEQIIQIGLKGKRNNIIKKKPASPSTEAPSCEKASTTPSCDKASATSSNTKH